MKHEDRERIIDYMVDNWEAMELIKKDLIDEAKNCKNGLPSILHGDVDLQCERIIIWTIADVVSKATALAFDDILEVIEEMY